MLDVFSAMTLGCAPGQQAHSKRAPEGGSATGHEATLCSRGSSQGVKPRGQGPPGQLGGRLRGRAPGDGAAKGAGASGVKRRVKRRGDSHRVKMGWDGASWPLLVLALALVTPYARRVSGMDSGVSAG
jgi:hypothetical protein